MIFPSGHALKFMFSKKDTNIDKIVTADLMHLLSKSQIDGDDFVNFYGLLRKHELYAAELNFYSP